MSFFSLCEGNADVTKRILNIFRPPFIVAFSVLFEWQMAHGPENAKTNSRFSFFIFCQLHPGVFFPIELPFVLSLHFLGFKVIHKETLFIVRMELFIIVKKFLKGQNGDLFELISLKSTLKCPIFNFTSILVEVHFSQKNSLVPLFAKLPCNCQGQDFP